MQKQSWSISSKDYIADDENYNRPDNTIMNQLNEESEEEQEEEEEQTLKPAHTLKSGKTDMVQRKSHEDDAREQIHK
jgi:hypothetical protein